MKQRTLKKSIVLSGTGLHSGQEARLSLSPAPANSGVAFVKGTVRVPALVEQIKDTRRGTSLDGIAVVEHLLSAVYALGIDNLLIEVDGDEVPTIDGSALPFVEALEKAGTIETTADKTYITLTGPIEISSGTTRLQAFPYDGFKIDFMVDFPSVGQQRYSFDSGKGNFKRDIAPARTFGYLEEYEILKDQGLALGASFENALVLGKDGYINSPRFQDEIVRHKILDLIGDLSLCGAPLKAEIKAEKSGHKLNVELARRLRQIRLQP